VDKRIEDLRKNAGLLQRAGIAGAEAQDAGEALQAVAEPAAPGGAREAGKSGRGGGAKYNGDRDGRACPMGFAAEMVRSATMLWLGNHGGDHRAGWGWREAATMLWAARIGARCGWR
jgi:hypothetical protein